MANRNVNRKTSELIDSLKNKEKVRILFVCLGNICRSPAADGIMQSKVDEAGLSDRFVIDSAGTGGYHIGDLPDNRMRIHARRRGYELTHRARKFGVGDFDEFDMIVAMDGSNERHLRNMARTVEDEAKIVQMAAFVDAALRYDYIPDPYYEGAEGFETVLNLLENGTDNMLAALK